jgi:uncharacterized protein (TIGR03437 family)
VQATGKWWVGILVCAFVFCGAAFAQPTIKTYAGNDAIFAGSGQPAIAAQLVGPTKSVVDGQGNVYISAPGLSMVLKVTAATGVISVFAGNGLNRFAGDGGLAVGASLASPQGLALDSAGNLYIADANNSNIRKVDTNGIITTVAGDSGQGGFAGDGGLATKALLENPNALAFDKSGNLYIVDSSNQRIRMVSASTGIISTIAGTGGLGSIGDGGAAIKATFANPDGIAVDSSGNVYIADQFAGRIRKFSVGGNITTVAGGGSSLGDNIPATQAQLSALHDVAVDTSGNLYIADAFDERIRRVGANGIITTIAGNGQAGFSGDGGPATAAMFSTPVGVALDASGNVYVADFDNNRIRRVMQGGAVTTIAGTITSIGDGGPSTEARLTSPNSIAVDSSGNLYIADPSANRIRKVTPSGTITTVAGTGQTGRGGDNGPATSAILNNPSSVALDSGGNLYIADTGNTVVRRVDATTGIITLFAGDYTCCYSGTGTGGDGGLATAATLGYDPAVAVDGLGNVYINNFVNPPPGQLPSSPAIRRVTTDGIIHTWAGGQVIVPGYSGDGGPPLQAVFSPNINITGGSDGSLYIADQGNNRVRKVDPSGATINRVVGNGQSNGAGDGGPATSAAIGSPLSVALDAAGNLYVGSGSDSTVRKVALSGIIGPYAGNGQGGFSGDGGPATAASLDGEQGLAVDAGNNLYIADLGNRRVRLVQAGGPPSIAVAPATLTFTAANASATPTSQNLTVTNTGGGTLNWAASATTASGGAWLTATPATGSSIAGKAGVKITVSANPTGLASGDYYGTVALDSSFAPNSPQVTTVRLTVTYPSASSAPQVSPAGVVHGASFTPKGPVAPGSIVSIFGTSLADHSILASTLPLPNQLAGASVTIGGRTLPLLYVSEKQINAQLPFGLLPNVTEQLVVTRDNMISAPEQVSVVASEPGVFTVNQSGIGPAVVTAVHTDGTENPVDANHPATAGDVLVIYCTGLGEVNPRAVAGFPIPLQPESMVVDPVTATIGGINVPVQFAGATSGFVGLYQVNVAVPSGIGPSATTPLVLSQGGHASRTVTIATK